MQYVADANEAKKIDGISIEQIGIPSIVLMERAALSVAQKIEKIADKETDSVLILCGSGNNGADGVAVARMLFEHGFYVKILLLGNRQKESKEMTLQLAIAQKLSISIEIKETFEQAKLQEYSILVDAIFGIGLSREVSGAYADWIEAINASRKKIIAVDIPSGIDATSGKVLGIAVKAYTTVTFGTLKRGLLLFPGALYAGQIETADVGFPQMAIKEAGVQCISYDREDILTHFPKRIPYTNKGNYGKVLVVAGSKEIAGAAYFCAKAAYKMGCGFVKVVTHENNRFMLQEKLPEALLTIYQENDDAFVKNQLQDDIAWADVIICGPGLMTSLFAKKLLKAVLNEKETPLVLDADALNLMAQMPDVVWQENMILTPHLKEMSRLLHTTVLEIKEDLFAAAKKMSPATTVLKDARTVILSGEKKYLNRSGNHALAKGGSGDVLSGMIGGLLARKLPLFEAASLAVYLHGLTADEYVKEKSSSSMFASDILEMIAKILP